MNKQMFFASVLILFISSSTLFSQNNFEVLLGYLRENLENISFDGNVLNHESIELSDNELIFKERDGRYTYPRTIYIDLSKVDENSIVINGIREYNSYTETFQVSCYTINFHTNEGVRVHDSNDNKLSTNYRVKLNFCGFLGVGTFLHATASEYEVNKMKNLLYLGIKEIREKPNKVSEREEFFNNFLNAEEIDRTHKLFTKMAEERRKEAEEDKKRKEAKERKYRRNMTHVYNVDTLYMSMFKEKVTILTIEVNNKIGYSGYGIEGDYFSITIPSDAIMLEHNLRIPTGLARKHFSNVITRMDVIYPDGKINSFEYTTDVQLNRKNVTIKWNKIFPDLGMYSLTEGNYFIKYYNQYGTLFTNQIKVLSPKNFKRYLRKKR